MKKNSIFILLCSFFWSSFPMQIGPLRHIIEKFNYIKTAFQQNPHLGKALKQKGDTPKELLQQGDDTNIIQAIREELEKKDTTELSPEILYAAITRVYPNMGNVISWIMDDPSLVFRPTRPISPLRKTSSQHIIPIVDNGRICLCAPFLGTLAVASPLEAATSKKPILAQPLSIYRAPDKIEKLHILPG